MKFNVLFQTQQDAVTDKWPRFVLGVEEMQMNCDGGTLPGPVKPWPEYRADRTKSEAFKETLKRCAADPEIDIRMARTYLLMSLGPTDKTLTELIVELIDDRREYEIRLGIVRGLPAMVNAG